MRLRCGRTLPSQVSTSPRLRPAAIVRSRLWQEPDHAQDAGMTTLGGAHMTRIRLLTALGTLMALLASCGDPIGSAPSERPSTIIVGGSGAAYPALKVMTETFTKHDPAVRFEYRPSSTTGAGARLLAAREIDIASLGLPLAEVPTDLVTYPVALDAVAVVVHPAVPVDALTVSQLRAIYSGTATSWAQIGVASTEPLIVLDRPEDETAKIVFRKVLGPELRITSSAVSLAKESDMVKAVDATAGSIGFFSYSYVAQALVRARPVTLDGAPPTVAAVRAGAYPATRLISFAVRRDDAARSPIRDVVESLSSDAFARALEAAGYAPAR